jgi:Protein of unknown function (DUF3617)
MRLHRAAAFTFLALASGAAAAMVDIKPGLWEWTDTTQMEGAPAMRMPDLSRLPPEQRARVEQMLADRASGKPRTVTRRSCVTTEQLQKWDAIAHSEREDTSCERKILEESSHHLRLKLSCPDGRMTATGDFTTAGGTSVSGKFVSVRQTEQGKQTITVSMTGHWVGSACGDIAPGESKRTP